MPNYKKHLFAGFITYSSLIFILNLNTTIFKLIKLLCCCLFGSLFPDIDTKSKIQKIFYFCILILYIFLFLKNQNKLITLFSFITLIPIIVNHRGIFHKSWFVILISITPIIITKLFFPKELSDTILSCLFFICGAISHIALDLGIKKVFRF